MPDQINDCQGEGPEFVERAHKDKLKADLLDKIADAISNEWSAKPGWHLHCAAAALTAIEDAGFAVVPSSLARISIPKHGE